MRPGNENLVGKAALAQMKPTAILLNTSRGEVLDAAALAESCAAGVVPVRRSMFWPEPPKADFPLLGLPRPFLLTPHLAARMNTALENMSWVVKDVVEVLDGRPAKYPGRRSKSRAFQRRCRIISRRWA